MPFIFLYHLHVLIFPMVNTCAGIDPLCTEQVNKIYVYFFKSLSGFSVLLVTQTGEGLGRHGTGRSSFDSSSFDSGCAQEEGSN